MVISETTCHAHGCKARTELFPSFQGQFCQTHFWVLLKIRRKIARAKRKGEIEAEIAARQAEADFREKYDAGHLFYIWKLEQTIQIRVKCPW